MNLGEILKFNAGPNRTRIKNIPQDLCYLATDIDVDLAQVDCKCSTTNTVVQKESFFTKEGDLIISLIKDKACIVTKKNANKCLTAAFIKCEYDKEKVDPWFICYFINESESFKKQKHIRNGLNGLSYLHITSDIIRQVEIELPDLKTQKLLGMLYKDSLKQKALYDLKTKLLLKHIYDVMNKKITNN